MNPEGVAPYVAGGGASRACPEQSEGFARATLGGRGESIDTAELRACLNDFEHTRSIGYQPRNVAATAGDTNNNGTEESDISSVPSRW